MLAQQEAKGEHMIYPRRGGGVTLDAGLNQREIADAIVKKGAYLNHARLRETLLQDLLARITQIEESAT